MFAGAEELPNRSDPLTPRADCFPSLRRTEECRFSSAFIVKKKRKKTAATPCLCTGSRKTLKTQNCRHAAASEGETVAAEFAAADI